MYVCKEFQGFNLKIKNPHQSWQIHMKAKSTSDLNLNQIYTRYSSF